MKKYLNVDCLVFSLSTVPRRAVCGGYIVVVQTNGSSGSYNPHMHIIMTSGDLARSIQRVVIIGLN